MLNGTRLGGQVACNNALRIRLFDGRYQGCQVSGSGHTAENLTPDIFLCVQIITLAALATNTAAQSAAPVEALTGSRARSMTRRAIRSR